MQLERMHRYMDLHGLDAVAAMDPMTVAYLINCYCRGLMPSHVEFKHHSVFPVFPRRSQAFVIDFPRIVFDPPAEVRPSWIKEFYRGSGGGFAGPEPNVAKLAEVVRQRGLDHGRIGLDMDFVPVNLMKLVQQALPAVEFVDAQPLYTQMRAIKTDKELRFIRQAISIAEEGFWATLRAWHPGTTTDDLFRVYATTIVSLGSDRIGCNFSQIYRQWFEQPCQRRDMRFGRWIIQEDDTTAIKFDFGGGWEGYNSDMNRRVYAGTPPKEWVGRVQADVRVSDVIVSVIRPGMSAREVHAAGREAITREFGVEILSPPAGEEYTFMHSIGLKTHEEPIVAFGEPAELHDPDLTYEVNTVFDLEPTWIEDMFVVTADGVKRLTTLPRRLFSV